MPAILILIPSSGGSECTGITGTLPFIESSPISFSGTKDNTFTITVSVTTPTANRTLTVANETGTIALRESSQTFSGNNTFSGDNTLSGNNTFSGISTFSGTIAGGTPFVFEGATANDFETSLAVTDPTADRTITIPDNTGTIILSADAATQAQMETASSTAVYVTPGRLHYHPGVEKAWANFQGSGTVTLRESYNVSSITDVGVGTWNVNIATDMSTTTYCPRVSGSATAITTFVSFTTQIIDAGSFQIHSQNAGGAAIDVLNVYASALGDQ